MLPAYAELHCFSNFSFLRGASHPAELVERAAELGYGALALTDQGSLAGVVRAHEAAKAIGFKLLIGADITLADGPHLVVLAPDLSAYGDLSELLTLGRRAADKGQYHLQRADLQHFSRHLLALWLPERGPIPSPATWQADAEWLAQHFSGRLWIAAEQHGHADDLEWLAHLHQLSQQTGLAVVAAGGVEMHRRSRRPLHDTLTAIRLGQPVAECGYALHANGERHLRQRLRLAQLYPAAWLEETMRVAERCQFSLDSLRYQYPQELVPPGLTPASYLAREVHSGLHGRYPGQVPLKVQQMVARELDLISSLAYEAYFLTVYDIVSWARRQGILCQGRGSAANSAVCYALGITAVDPARTEMLFERFLSKERNEPPDIDVDFEHSRREEVIQYIYQKYGRDRAALTATVIRYRPRSALRDVGRALGFDEEQLHRLSSILAWWDKRDDLPARLADAGCDPDSRPVQWLLQLVNQLIGFPRHLSQHVGGFVISHGPLSRQVPIENASMADRTVIQWDKDDLDIIGMLKIDVLALGMLTALRESLQLVSARYGKPFGLTDIPAEDPAVYDMLGRADSIGVFQIESRAQMSMLPRLKPKHFYDLVIEVAIVRPGPIQGGMVHPYLRRRQGLEEVDYPSEAVKNVLQRTLGVPIFQEQVMQIAIVAAGFSGGEADQLRRSMAAWRRTGKLEPFRARLTSGMLERGYSQDFADRIFRQIEGFSEYGFPESHAASFALLVYSSAWLKRHEPAAFCCALLNAQPMGFYAPAQLVQDAQRHGVEVRPVDVQASHWQCTLEDGTNGPALRLGLRLVEGLGTAAGQRIAAARPAGGYRSPAQLAQLARLDASTLTTLATADALHALSGNRREAWWDVSGLTRHNDLLDTAPIDDSLALPAPELGEAITADYHSVGLSLRAHPVSLLRPQLSTRKLVTATALSTMPNGRLARAGGLVISRQRPGTAQGVVFVTLEDETGSINVIVWSDLVNRQRRELLESRLMLVYGVVQREGDVVHLLARRLVDATPLLGDLSTRSREFH